MRNSSTKSNKIESEIIEMASFKIGDYVKVIDTSKVRGGITLSDTYKISVFYGNAREALLSYCDKSILKNYAGCAGGWVSITNIEKV